MKRGGFARAEYPRAPRTPLALLSVPIQHAMRAGDTRHTHTEAPKAPPRRSEAYRRYVASQPCSHCNRHGPSQCAHGDEGKGMAIKAGDDTCFSLCADQPGRRGCHSMIGASGMFTQSQRRTLEARYSAAMRSRAMRDGQWPEGWL